LRFVNEIGVRAFPDWTGTEVTGDRLPELAEATSYDELWRLAQRWVEDDHDTPALRRLRCIKAEIIRQSYAGTLLLTVRRVSGGPFKAFQSEWWNRDKPTSSSTVALLIRITPSADDQMGSRTPILGSLHRAKESSKSQLT
jgi:hypothetical protein